MSRHIPHALSHNAEDKTELHYALLDLKRRVKAYRDGPAKDLNLIESESNEELLNVRQLLNEIDLETKKDITTLDQDIDKTISDVI